MNGNFIFPSKKMLKKVSSRLNYDFFSKTDGELIKKTTLKINGRKETGWVVNGFYFNKDEDAFSFDIENYHLVFIDERFAPCLRRFLADESVLSIVVDAQEILGRVYPKVKYRMDVITRVIPIKKIGKQN